MKKIPFYRTPSFPLFSYLFFIQKEFSKRFSVFFFKELYHHLICLFVCLLEDFSIFLWFGGLVVWVSGVGCSRIFQFPMIWWKFIMEKNCYNFYNSFFLEEILNLNYNGNLMHLNFPLKSNFPCSCHTTTVFVLHKTESV